MSFRIVLAADERASGDEEEITCSVVAVAAAAHALTKLPAVTIIISSSATDGRRNLTGDPFSDGRARGGEDDSGTDGEI